MSNSIIDSLDTLYKEGVLTLEDILKLLNVPTATKVNNTSAKDACTVDDTVPTGYKKCHRCGEVLPIDHFNKDNARSDGLFVWCKQCSKEYNKQYLQKKKEERQHNNTTIGHKKCSNCGQVLPIDSFDKDSGKKDGHNSWCKECRRIYNRQQVQKNKKRNEDNVTPLTGYKKCIKCGQVLPIDQFNKNRTKKDGLSTWCSDCCREYAEQYRQKNREKNTKENNNCDDLYIKIDSIDNEQLINSIKQIALQYKGEQTVYICTEQPKQMYRWDNIKVNINSELIIKLQELLGGDNVLVKDNNNKQKNTNQKNNNADVSLVESSWKKVIEKIKDDRKLSIAALLREVSSFNVKDNILYLIFNDNFTFARTRLNSQDTIKYVESVIREVTNRSFNIQIYLKSEVANLHNQQEINSRQRRFKWQL